MPDLSFHLFPRLPLELRQCIWAFSREPREVVVGDKGCLFLRHPRSPPPPLLHACAEFRSYLQRFYQQSFVYGSPARYAWVDFNRDTIHMLDFDLEEFPAELPFIRGLVLECRDPELFFWKWSLPVSDATALETLTILDVSMGGPAEEWWTEWIDQMERWYFGCRHEAVTFHTRIRNADDPNCVEITRHNYLKMDRDQRRRLLEKYPEPDAEISDDDDEEMSRPGRFRGGWRHTKDCKCIYN